MKVRRHRRIHWSAWDIVFAVGITLGFLALADSLEEGQTWVAQGGNVNFLYKIFLGFFVGGVLFMCLESIVVTVVDAVLWLGTPVVARFIWPGRQLVGTCWFVCAAAGLGVGVLLSPHIDRPDKPKKRNTHSSQIQGCRVDCWSSRRHLKQPEGTLEDLVAGLDNTSLSKVRIVRQNACVIFAGGRDDHVIIYYSPDYEASEVWWAAGHKDPTAPRTRGRVPTTNVGTYNLDMPAYTWQTPEYAQHVLDEFLAHDGRLHIDPAAWTGGDEDADTLKPYEDDE